jgi:hypothetical protein
MRLNLRLISETATTVTLGHDPVDCDGFRLQPIVKNGVRQEGKWAHTWDGTRTEHKFAAGHPPYIVEALTVSGRGVYEPRLLGVHQDLHYWGEPARSQLIDVAVSLGANVSRSSLLWDMTQPSASTFDWARMDSIVQELVERKIEPLLYPIRFPSWLPGFTDWNVLPDDWASAAEAYVEFCAAAASRYKGRVRHWEIWNEPNERWFWSHGSNDAAARIEARERYADLYVAARAVILAESPDAYVAVGGITGLGASGDPPGSGNQWLIDLLGMNQINPGNLSHLAIHPYTAGFTAGPDDETPWQPHFSDIALIRATLDTRGYQDTELWTTEWGWQSTAPLTEALQAEYVARALERLRDHYPYVRISTYFLDADQQRYKYGLFRDDRVTEKPAAAQFRAVAPHWNQPATGGNDT